MTVADERDPLPQADEIEPGEYRCFDCGAAITVTAKGVEVGHSNGSSGHEGTCPRREEHYENKRGELA